MFVHAYLYIMQSLRLDCYFFRSIMYIFVKIQLCSGYMELTDPEI